MNFILSMIIGSITGGISFRVLFNLWTSTAAKRAEFPFFSEKQWQTGQGVILPNAKWARLIR